MTLLNTGLTSWAVDLKDVGAIYPFQGFEVPMVIAGVAFWVLWHIWQIGHENAELRAKSGHVDATKVKANIDRY
jgi:hypothetical protein